MVSDTYDQTDQTEQTPTAGSTNVDPVLARIETIEAAVNKYTPMLEDLYKTAASANAQGHTFGSMLSALASQLFGVKL